MAVRPGTALSLALAAVLAASGAAAQDPVPGEYALGARVWLDRGAEPVFDRGDRARVYYRTTDDAYVAILRIDTNGSVRLLFPRSPSDDHYVRGGRDYRLVFPSSAYWHVDDDPGKGYFFIIASPTPLDLGVLPYARYEGGWDLSPVGRNVYSDPYVAMDDWVALLVPDWQYTEYALDFASYDVGESHDYPRFLCYDCHGYQPYYAWNPYRTYCTSFRVVIWNDPYFYPTYRYRGANIVYVRPPEGRRPRYEFKERADGEPGTPVVRIRPGDSPGLPGDVERRRGTPGGSPGAATPGVDDGRRTVSPAPRSTREDVDRRPPLPDETRRTVPRRPTGVLPGRTPTQRVPTARSGAEAERSETGAGVRPDPGVDSRSRPTLERRPPEARPVRPGEPAGPERRPATTRIEPRSAPPPGSIEPRIQPRSGRETPRVQPRTTTPTPPSTVKPRKPSGEESARSGLMTTPSRGSVGGDPSRAEAPPRREAPPRTSASDDKAATPSRSTVRRPSSRAPSRGGSTEAARTTPSAGESTRIPRFRTRPSTSSRSPESSARPPTSSRPSTTGSGAARRPPTSSAGRPSSRPTPTVRRPAPSPSRPQARPAPRPSGQATAPSRGATTPKPRKPRKPQDGGGSPRVD